MATAWPPPGTHRAGSTPSGVLQPAPGAPALRLWARRDRPPDPGVEGPHTFDVDHACSAPPGTPPATSCCGWSSLGTRVPHLSRRRPRRGLAGWRAGGLAGCERNTAAWATRCGSPPSEATATASKTATSVAPPRPTPTTGPPERSPLSAVAPRSASSRRRQLLPRRRRSPVRGPIGAPWGVQTPGRCGRVEQPPRDISASAGTVRSATSRPDAGTT